MAGASEISVVLVHGGFVDGSGWESVYRMLKGKGYSATIVQSPTICILVGHSYGGVVITAVGNDPKVAGLGYIAAFAPDKGLSRFHRRARPYRHSAAPGRISVSRQS